MEMCYDGALVMPRNYAVVSEEEMTYVEGGATASVTIKGGFSSNLIKAVANAGVGVATGLITGAVCAALSITGVGALLIPAAIGAVSSLISSYAMDKRIKGNKYFSKTVSCWSPVKWRKTINIGLIGW